MNALKYIAVAVAVLALGSAVADDDNYIYWMVENAHYYEEPGYGIEFAYATISVDNGATYLSPAAAADETGFSTDGGVYSGTFDSANAKTFLVELWAAGTDERVGWMRYSASALSDYFYQNAGSHGGGSPFVVSAVVPEPTSGLLSLFGLAALALRRKRA